MKRYYIADVWSDGVYDYCYVVTLSTTEGARVWIAQVVGDKYVLEDDVTEAVANAVPIAEMFECSYEIEDKQVYHRVAREDSMARKKEFDTAVLVRMSKEHHEKLEKIAQAKGIALADVIRSMINRAKCPKQ